MTSLQRQLASIAATSSHELDTKALRAAHAQSLLFEPKVAATQSFDTLYQLCVEGFEELCDMDARFIKYGVNLFSIHSKKEDREQMTAHQNEELNVVLESFLGLVGARLLLKPALKAVEWTVRRFRVQQYNTPFLILTFLPYHDTPIFSTLLSILPKRLPPTYKFLHPYINTLSSPPRAALAHAATNNIPFVSALNAYVIRVAKLKHHYHILLAFWAGLVAQSIDGRISASMSGRKALQSQQEEDILLQVLSTLNEALALKKNSELILGCYMIITVLVSKADLSERVLNALLSEVVTSWNVDTVEAGLNCASIIIQQQQSAILPKPVLRSILRQSTYYSQLQKAADYPESQRLAVSLVLTAIRYPEAASDFDSSSLAERLLTSKSMPIETKSVLIEGVLRHLADTSSEADEGLIASVAQLPEAREISLRILPNNTKLLSRMETLTEAQSNSTEDIDMDAEETTSPLVIQSGRIVDTIDLSEFRESIETSFFESTTSTLFVKLRKAFWNGISTENESLFLDIPTLQRHNILRSPNFLTFLACTWCEDKLPEARRSALRICISSLEALTAEQPDVQSLLPYALLGLIDPSSVVRKIASNLMVVLGKLYEPLRKQKSALEKKKIWASDTLYGTNTESISWLCPKDAFDFVTVIINGLEECIADPNHLGRLIQATLDGSSNSHSIKSEPEKTSLKSAQKAAIFVFLSDHLERTGSARARYGLLSVLNHVERVGHQSRSKHLLPAFKKWLSQDSELEVTAPQQNLHIPGEESEYLKIIQASDSESIDLLLSIARADAGLHRPALQNLAFQRLRHLWNAMKPPMQKSVAEALLQMSTSTSRGPQTGESMSVLQSVRIPSSVFVAFIGECLSAFSLHAQPPTPKKRKLDIGDTIHVGKREEPEDKQALSKLTIVLDLLHSSKVDPDLELFQSLFRVMELLQSFRKYNISDSAYLQAITLDAMSPMVSVINSKTTDARSHAELLVDVVRNTTNQQARNSALLLLSSLAKHDPGVILHSVMPIFTLMSATTMRQSDDFSAHVVDQTIRTVVPLLAESLRKQKRDLVAATAEILLNFAAAFEHIPPQRKLRLYGLLASSLGPTESLFAIIATLVDRFPESDEVPRFSIELLKPFPAVVNLHTIKKYLDLALDSFQPRPVLFQLLAKNSLHGRRDEGLKAIFATIATLLRGGSLPIKLIADLRTADDTSDALRTLFGDLLERVIKLIRLSTENNIPRALCAPLLEALLELLPFDQFSKSVEPLLETADEDLAQSVIKSLEVRIKSCSSGDRIASVAVMQLLPRLSHILERSQKASLRQNAISCIDQAIGKYGKTDVSATLAAAKVIVQSYSINQKDSLLPILALHCLASTVEILGNDYIPLLQQSINIGLEALQRSLKVDLVDQRLHNASFALFTAVVEYLPYVLSSGSLQEIVTLASRSATMKLRAESKENRIQMLRLAARHVDLKVIVDVVRAVWQSSLDQGYQALHEVLVMLKSAVDLQPKSVIVRHARPLFEYFLQAFDLRRICTAVSSSTSYNDEEVVFLEKTMIETLIATVFKINDTVFRPFFIRLLDQCLPRQTAKGAESRTSQAITFFRLVTALSSRLKSIFTSYFGLMLEQMGTILATKAGKDTEAQTLQTTVLEALSSAFKFDQDDFWQAPSHFNAILPQLLSQLSSQPMSFVQSTVIPAITELANAATSADNAKSMNSGLLKLMKSGEARERLAAVRCEMSLTDKLGDEWLSQLPEMLPAINELQDDDDEKVERETHRWIKMIESVLGENLDSMLQ